MLAQRRRRHVLAGSGGGAPTRYQDIAGCVCALDTRVSALWQNDGSTAATADGDTVRRIDDLSGNARHWKKLSGVAPTLGIGDPSTGRKVLVFTDSGGTPATLDSPTTLTNGLTAGEVFVRLRLTNTNSLGLHDFGAGTGNTTTYYLNTATWIYESWGRLANLGADRVIVTAPSAVTGLSWHTYNVQSQSGSYAIEIDTVVKATAGTNTVTFPSNNVSKIGQAINGGYLRGKIEAYVIYDHVLTAPERGQVHTILAAGPAA